MSPVPHVLVLDSGVGGLSIVHSILQSNAGARITYVADDGYFPYGDKPADALERRVVSLVTTVQAEVSADMVVIACNTASTIVLPALRQMLSVPVIGVVPAIKPAGLWSVTRRIGLLATPATVKRPYIDELIGQFAADCEVTRVGTTALVAMAEDWVFAGRLDLQALEGILAPFASAQVDVIVLGCTHFPLLAAQIRAALPPGITLLDSGRAIARRVHQVHPAVTDARRDGAGRDVLMFTGSGRQPARLAHFLSGLGMHDPDIRTGCLPPP